jgi:hypothetical protein
VEELGLEIAESEFDNKVVRYFGEKKMLKLISQKFHWPIMEE